MLAVATMICCRCKGRIIQIPAGKHERKNNQCPTDFHPKNVTSRYTLALI